MSKRYSTMSSCLGMYTIFDDKKREPLNSRRVIKLLEENEQLKKGNKNLKQTIEKLCKAW